MKGEDVVRSLYGAILSGQGRGFYVGLELMALLRGTWLTDSQVLPSPGESPLSIRRRSHDFARRLMGEPRHLGEKELEGIQGDLAVEALAALGRGLRVPVPGRRKRQPWHAEHFQPFVGELVHYDAVFRRNSKRAIVIVGGRGMVVSTERYLYRGAGGLAHMILRSDTDKDRLARSRNDLKRLVQDSGTPLGELFDALASRDKGDSSEDGTPLLFKDEPEFLCLKFFKPDSRWVERLREGVARIAARSLPPAKRAEALMHWVPFCIARYQEEVSFRLLDDTPSPIPLDLGTKASPIRRRSREVHDRCRAKIVEALEEQARAVAPHVLESRTRSWRDGARMFFPELWRQWGHSTLTRVDDTL